MATLEVSGAHVAATRETLTIGSGHVARSFQTLEVSGAHRAQPQSVLEASGAHRADLTNKLTVSGAHRAGPQSQLTVSGAHTARVGEAIPVATVVPLGPELGTPYIPLDPGAVPGVFNINILTGLRRPWIKVHGGPNAKTLSADFGSVINGGWSADLTFGGLHDIEFDQYDPIRIEASDGAGGHILTPELVAESRETSESFGGPRTSFSLIDLDSFKLSEGGRSLNTFLRVHAGDIVSGIEAEWGVKKILRAPSFPVLEEDIKDSAGWDALLRLAAVNADSLVVNGDGNVEFIRNDQKGPGVAFKADSIRRAFTPSLSYTGFSAVKTSTIPGGGIQRYTFTQPGYATFQLRSPLIAVLPRDRSVAGGTGYLSLWQGQPGSPTSKLVAFHLLGQLPVNLSVPVEGGIATHAAVRVYPPKDGSATDAALELLGSSPEPAFAGTDLAFVVRSGSGRRTKVWREQMLPAEAFVQARLSRYLWEASKTSRTLEYEGACNLDMQLTTELLRSGYPSNRAEEVRHSFADGQVPRTTVRAVLL